MKFSLRLLLWQVPRASHIQGHFNFNAKILVLCRKKGNREEIDFISLSMILVLFVLFYIKDTQTAFWTNFQETIRGYHKNSFLLSLVPRLFQLGHSWTLPWAVTSPRDALPLSPRLHADNGSRENPKGLGCFSLVIASTLSFKLRFSIAELQHFFCDHGSFYPSFPLKSEGKHERLICRFSLCSCPKLAIYIYAIFYYLQTSVSVTKGFYWVQMTETEKKRSIPLQSEMNLGLRSCSLFDYYFHR